MISAIARFGNGLPANLIPVGLHSITSLGHVELLGILASGASHIHLLASPENIEELDPLKDECELSIAVMKELGFDDQNRITLLSESDPDKVEVILWQDNGLKPVAVSSFQPDGSKRDIARLIFSALHERAPKKPDIAELPKNAPYGKVEINQEACTLCMACTAACPANAITDTPGEPKLRFTEAACVQCGLCVNTCPENALSLFAQLDFTPAAMQPQILYEEEPFECITCGKPFATKSTIERISEQLAGKHSMFVSDDRAQLIKMCEDCRIEAQANSTEDPFMVGSRPKPRTTEDYIAAEKGDLSADDFLIED